MTCWPACFPPPGPPPTPPAPQTPGLVSRDDMQVMLRQLAGSTLTDGDLDLLIQRGFDGAGAPQGLTLSAFKAAMAGRDLSSMEVSVPTDIA
jgi:serine/threonine-protein phosphatase 2B regulatory subunit